MSNVKQLAGETSPDFDIKSAEADHDAVKVTITLSPLTQFIIEGALDMRTRSAKVRQLLDSAALDLLEAKGYTLDSDKFRQLYYKFLTQDLQTDYHPDTGEEYTYYPLVRL